MNLQASVTLLQIMKKILQFQKMMKFGAISTNKCFVDIVEKLFCIRLYIYIYLINKRLYNLLYIYLQYID
jgi:hypothetical protein